MYRKPNSHNRADVYQFPLDRIGASSPNVGKRLYFFFVNVNTVLTFNNNKRREKRPQLLFYANNGIYGESKMKHKNKGKRTFFR